MIWCKEEQVLCGSSSAHCWKSSRMLQLPVLLCYLLPILPPTTQCSRSYITFVIGDLFCHKTSHLKSTAPHCNLGLQTQIYFTFLLEDVWLSFPPPPSFKASKLGQSGFNKILKHFLYLLYKLICIQRFIEQLLDVSCDVGLALTSSRACTPQVGAEWHCSTWQTGIFPLGHAVVWNHTEVKVS